MNSPQSQEPTRLPVSPSNTTAASTADYDEPYTFGRRPRAIWPAPFTERQYARLLIFRSRVAERQASGRPVELTLIEGGWRPAA
jgi:hypothetical protein